MSATTGPRTLAPKEAAPSPREAQVTGKPATVTPVLSAPAHEALR